MRRSRALVIFGGLLVSFSAATVSARSQAPAAGQWRDGDESGPGPVCEGPALLSVTAESPAVFGKLIDTPRPPVDLPPPPELASAGACSADMVEVDGDYCPYLEQKCLRWLDPETKLQCAEFEKLPSSGRCSEAAQPKHFCIDRYEWPNELGALPAYMTSWYEAKASCESIGKRLCSDTEWTLACEGPERQPYPYGDGYERDDRACNIDKPYILPNEERFYDPKTQADELARLDQREPSGSRASCVSPYGVHDMVGNVDEWVVNVSQLGRPYLSGLKGGYWGPVRTRCRPMTTAHDENFRYYQIGFRCCSDPRPLDLALAPVASR